MGSLSSPASGEGAGHTDIVRLGTRARSLSKGGIDLEKMDVLVRRLEESLSGKEGRIVLLSTRYPFMAPCIMALFKLLVGKQGRTTFYIGADRPQFYLKRLLMAHGVPIDNLKVIDVISGISSEEPSRSGPNGVVYIRTPFCFDVLHDVINHLEIMIKTAAPPPPGEDQASAKDHIERMKGFLILDNLTVMETYMDQDCMKTFITRLVDRMKGGKGCISIITMADPDLHPDLYALARSMTDEEIKIDQEWFGAKSPVARPAARSRWG